MRSIAIVGANSYIARNFIKFMENEAYSLFLYDKDNYHRDACDNYCSVDLFSNESMDIINFDCDYMYIFTGKTGTVQGFDDSSVFIDVNEKALINILNAYRKHKSRAKIVFPSTRLLYKGSEKTELSEEAEKEFKTVYAINKYACEQYLKMYHEMFGVSYCVARICVPYGTLIKPIQSYGTADFFLNRAIMNENIQIYGDGSQRRTFTHIWDLCNILLYMAKSAECDNDVYNVGGETASLVEIADRIAMQYNVQVEHISWPQNAKLLESGSTVFNSRKLDHAIGYDRYKSISSWVLEFK